MALFNSNMQSGPQAQQLGFAPQAVQAPSFAPPTVPTGYGQMQGQPLLSRNPNYGVASGIAALLGGQNPMGAPQAGALLTPQQASPNAMEGINPLTGQPFQVFDSGVRDQIVTQEQQAQKDMLEAAQKTQAEEQAATQAAQTALGGYGMTGTEADRRFQIYAADNNLELDENNKPIFDNENKEGLNALYDQGYRGTSTIRYSQEELAAKAAENEAAKTPEQKAQEAMVAEAAKPRDVKRAQMSEAQFRAAYNEGLVDPDDDVFEDTEGRFGEAGVFYSLTEPDNLVYTPSTSGGQGGIASMMQNAPLRTGAPAPTSTQATFDPGVGGEGSAGFGRDYAQEQRDILNGFFGGNAILPGDPGYEAALAEAGPASGGLFSGGGNLTPEQIERIKAAQAANPGGGFLGKIRAGSGSGAPAGKFQETLLSGAGNIPPKPNTTKMTNNRTPKKVTAQDIQRAMSRMDFGGMF